MPPTVDRHITDSWPICHRHMTDIRSRCVDRYIDRQSTDSRSMYLSTVDRLSIDTRSTVDRQSIDTRSTLDRESTECRSSIDRLSTATSTDIAVDIAVDITYSKHDPKILSFRIHFKLLSSVLDNQDNAVLRKLDYFSDKI